MFTQAYDVEMLLESSDNIVDGQSDQQEPQNGLCLQQLFEHTEEGGVE